MNEFSLSRPLAADPVNKIKFPVSHQYRNIVNKKLTLMVDYKIPFEHTQH